MKTVRFKITGVSASSLGRKIHRKIVEEAFRVKVPKYYEGEISLEVVSGVGKRNFVAGRGLTRALANICDATPGAVTAARISQELSDHEYLYISMECM